VSQLASTYTTSAATSTSLVALGQPAPPPSAPAAPSGTIAPKVKASCDEQRRKGRYNIYFDKVEIEKLVQTVADVTCRTFILPENIRGKISIIGPENGKVEVTSDQFYAAFLAALDSNSLAVYEHGKFLKIVDKQRAATEYALLSSVFALSRSFAGWASGFGAEAMGYSGYFLLTFFLAFPAYLLLPWVKAMLARSDAGGTAALSRREP
jgi:hypothetical protein